MKSPKSYFRSQNLAIGNSKMLSRAFIITFLTPLLSHASFDSIEERKQDTPKAPVWVGPPLPGNRIVGGTPVTDIDLYPFFCTTAPHNCGCSLIAPDIIITAAHCASTYPVGGAVIIGGVKRNGEDALDVKTMAEVFIHPDFNPILPLRTISCWLDWHNHQPSRAS